MANQESIPANQESLKAAEALIRHEATDLGPEFYLDTFYTETKCGLPVLEALNMVLAEVKKEKERVAKTKPDTCTPILPGFKIPLDQERDNLPPITIIRPESIVHPVFRRRAGAILMVLLRHVNHSSGLAWPSVPLIADTANVARRHVQEDLVWLQGAIVNGHSIIEWTGKTTRSGVRYWKINPAFLSQPAKPNSSAKAQHRRDDQSSHKGVTNSVTLNKPKNKTNITTTTQPTRVAPSLAAPIKNGGGGSSVNNPQQKLQTPESTSTIVNSQILPGASKTTLRLVENLLTRANIPADIATGILRTTAQAAEAGNIKTSHDRYIGGLIGRYRDGCYVPEVQLQQESASDKAAVLAETHRQEAEARKAQEKLETAMKKELEVAKRRLSPVEIAQHRQNFIEHTRLHSEFNYKRHRAAGWTGFAFNLGLDNYLRGVLLS